MSDVTHSIENDPSGIEPALRETQLPSPLFSAVIGIICFAYMIFLR